MNALLTHSNHLFYDRKQVQKMQPYPPLQTLLAAAALRQSGFTVEVCDTTFEDPENHLDLALRSSVPCLLVVCEDDFNFLTKMCLAQNREVSFALARLGRKYGCRIAVHGSDASDHVPDYLAAGFDYVLLGEVEETLCELIAGCPPETIAGLAYKVGATQGVIYNPRRRLRKNLDALPSPAWDLIDIEPYRTAWISRHRYFSMNLVSSRGCPYRCNWCAKPVYGNSYHVRSARAVAAEMLFVKHRYRPDHIWFADDIFALSASWTHQFSVAVQELGAQIPFKMQSRCDLMTRDTVSDLKRAGCTEVWMGAESGSQKILDAMDKNLRVEEIYRAREHLARNGIRVGLFLQFGYPAEGWPEIEDTIRMIRETQPDDIGVSVSYPLPGTKFYQLVSGQIGPKANWSHSGDLSMMFRGAYSSDVYRALADALHLEVR
ncbi:MAG: radical SAM protein, partial [Acidobacteriaceae bacterium]|nr:radical SAM protein [Acidobacteriaceae bacterium]